MDKFSENPIEVGDVVVIVMDAACRMIPENVSREHYKKQCREYREHLSGLWLVEGFQSDPPNDPLACLSKLDEFGGKTNVTAEIHVDMLRLADAEK